MLHTVAFRDAAVADVLLVRPTANRFSLKVFQSKIYSFYTSKKELNGPSFIR